MTGMLDWANLLLRLLHIIAGIGWIGSSFYFVWLDRNLAPSTRPDAGVDGDLWMVHSGGFYHIEKHRFGTGTLPATLHWVKWEAALTWASGMLLLAVVYYMTGGVYLLDPAVSGITAGQAAALTLGACALAWFAYDALWRSRLARAVWPAAVVSLLFVGAVAYAASHLLGGRAAFIHVGTLVGTLMVVNVWAVIIPGQRRMVDAMARGVTPDLTLGEQAKMRSMHNSYVTFPMIFIMVSSHFPQTYAGSHGWIVLLLLSVGGAAARHAMIGATVAGLRKEWALVPMALCAAGAMAVASGSPGTAPRSPATGAIAASAGTGTHDARGAFAEARVVITARCLSCHSSAPTDSLFTVPPNGVVFDTPQQMRAFSARILERAVVQRTMPFANRTGISDAERDVLRRWVESGAALR